MGQTNVRQMKLPTSKTCQCLQLDVLEFVFEEFHLGCWTFACIFAYTLFVVWIFNPIFLSLCVCVFMLMCVWCYATASVATTLSLVSPKVTFGGFKRCEISFRVAGVVFRYIPTFHNLLTVVLCDRCIGKLVGKRRFCSYKVWQFEGASCNIIVLSLLHVSSGFNGVVVASPCL